MRTRFIGLSVLAILAAAAASQFLYEALLVPRLSGIVAAVPLHWWLALSAPALLTVLGCGWFTRSWREALTVAALAAVALQLGIHVAALSGRAGWHKNFAIEAPLYHYTVGVASIFLFLVVLIGLGSVTHAGSRQAAS
jgi:hypothetical protein